MTIQVQSDPVRKIVRLIVKAVSPDQIILFGSKARGASSEDSDYDFLIVVSEIDNEREISRQIYRALLKNDVRQAVDVIVVPREKLEKHKENPYFVYAQALREGKLFYERATAV